MDVAQVIAQLKALIAQLEGGTPVASLAFGPTLVPASGPIPMGSLQPEWDAEGKAANDFWHMGVVGCQKGATKAQWINQEFAEAWSVAWDELHTFVVKSDGSLTSSADIGWQDGTFNPDNFQPGADRAAAWVKAGRPGGFTNTGDRANGPGPGVAG